MSEGHLHKLFNGARHDDRQVNELISLTHGIVADGAVNQQEAEYLQKWLAANAAVRDNPVVTTLFSRINDILSDRHLDSEKAKDLFETLTKFSGADFELGEILKSSSLPPNRPQPKLRFEGSRFCFTDSFAFGSRKACEAAIVRLGGAAGSLNRSTDCLIVGVYATDSWVHSSYGRKIEKAVEMQNNGIPIAIVGEEHWASHL